jgi:cytochrome c biogenesis protein CcmG/thiol:disulfide interchange protein DsbE
MRLTHFARAAMFLALALTACDRGDQPEHLGTPAPAFSLSDGQHSVDLAQLRGHVVLLNFWASWCAPCLEELPSLQALQGQLPQLRVVAISFDQDQDSYQRFLTLHHDTLLNIWDPAERINTLYGTSRPPETFLIDKQGLIRRKFIGPQDWTSPDILSTLRKLAAG